MSKFTLKSLFFLNDDYVDKTLILNNIPISDKISNRYQLSNIFYKADILTEDDKRLFQKNTFKKFYIKTDRFLLFYAEKLNIDTKGKDRFDIITEILKTNNFMNIIEDVDTNSKTYEKVGNLIKRFPIEITGLRKGETIIGVQKSVDKIILRNTGKLVPPYRKELNNIMQYGYWDLFMNKLNSIEFFNNMSDIQKEDWLYDNANDKDTYVHEIEGTEFSIISLGIKSDKKTKMNKFYEKLKEEQIDLLLENPDRKWKATEIMDEFPKRPGSKSKRHVLIFNRYFWKIYTDYDSVKNYKGLTINLENGTIKKNVKASSEENIIVLKDIHQQDVGFLVKTKSDFNERIIYGCILEILPQYNINDIEIIKSETSNFTPAAYKSLMQKIMRYRPQKVKFRGDIEFNSDFCLLVTISLLMLSPGSFVPDIQRYVSGLESGTKRLAVTMFEDAYVEPGDRYLLASLLASSLLRQRVKTWKPDISLIKEWFKLSLKALKSDFYFVYDFNSSYPKYDLKNNMSVLQLSSSLLDQLKSFQGDLNMVREIAKFQKKSDIKYIIRERPSYMPVSHCVDQHWAPYIAYYYDVEVVENMIVTGSKPLSKLFNNLFSRVTGINSRKSKIIKDDFFEATRKAQKLVLLSLQSHKRVIPVSEELFKFNYSINPSWIAGMLGPIEIKEAIVTLNSNNLYELLAVKRPSRNVKDPRLTETRRQEVIQQAKELLKRGIIMNKSNPPMDFLKNSILQLVNNKYLIKTKYGNFTLNSLKSLSNDIYYMESLNLTENIDIKEKAILYRSSGIDKNEKVLLNNLLGSTKINYIKKALIYISSSKKVVEFNSVSRDGGGTKLLVNLDDVGAFKFLSSLSNIYPLALTKTSNNAIRFYSDFLPLLFYIRDRISRYVYDQTVETLQIKEEENRWTRIYDKEGRKPEDHQSESLKEMIQRNKNGKRGHMIWIKQGLGKTFIVMSYLKYLRNEGKLPKHVIYLLPDTAIKSIIKEVSFFNFNLELLWTTKTKIPEDLLDVVKKGFEPTPYKVTLIGHDKFKKEEAIKSLSSIASESIVIFDEVHKMLNESIRTTMALQLSYLSQDFIALSGTMLIDEKIYKLINWLEQIVNFEVNNKNFFVAANSMIAKVVNTGVKVIDKEIIASFDENEEAAYKNLVSIKLGGNKTDMGPGDVNKAINLCIEVATKKLISEILKKLQKGIHVMVVAKNNSHQEEIEKQLIQSGIKKNDIFLIQSGKSLNLTDEDVNSGKVHDYKVVITITTKSLGYTLTRINQMISIVYPSNNADREQMRGRINRLGQNSKTVTYTTIHLGILTNILKRYDGVASMSKILKELSL